MCSRFFKAPCAFTNTFLLAIIVTKLNEEALEIDRVVLQELLAHLSSVQIGYVVVLNTSRLWWSDHKKT